VLAGSKMSLKNTAISHHFKMFFLSFAHQLNKIYLAASNLKIVEDSFSTYIFFKFNRVVCYCFYRNNYYHNPQGLNQFILPIGLFKGFPKINHYSFSQQQAEFKS
jgi:hypothetical protein